MSRGHVIAASLGPFTHRDAPRVDPLSLIITVLLLSDVILHETGNESCTSLRNHLAFTAEE